MLLSEASVTLKSPIVFLFIVTDNFSFLFKSRTSKLSVMLFISSCLKISFFWLMVFKLKLQEDVGILKSTPSFKSKCIFPKDVLSSPSCKSFPYGSTYLTNSFVFGIS